MKDFVFGSRRRRVLLRYLTLGIPERAMTLVRLWTSSLRVLPDFLVIGAQKAGTTSAYAYLTDHPMVKSARFKEVQYFDKRDLPSRAWYKSHFPIALGQRGWITGEANPSNIMSLAAPERVLELMPHAKIIAVIRDPAQRAYSHYRFNRGRIRGNVEPCQTFLEALQAESERLQAAGTDRDSYARFTYSYAGRGYYGAQLQRWYELFPRESIKVYLSSDMGKSPQAFASDVYEFLGLPPHTLRKPKSRNVRPAREPMSAEEREFLSGLYGADGALIEDLTGLSIPWARR